MFGEKSSIYNKEGGFSKKAYQSLQLNLMKFYFNCQLPTIEFQDLLWKQTEYEREIAKSPFFVNDWSGTRVCMEHMMCGMRAPRQGQDYNMKELQEYAIYRSHSDLRTTSSFYKRNHISSVNSSSLYQRKPVPLSQFYKRFCNSKKMVAAKVIRINKLSNPMVDFLEEDKENIKIIYVLRDPRATMASAMKHTISNQKLMNHLYDEKSDLDEGWLTKVNRFWNYCLGRSIISFVFFFNFY